MLEIELKNVKLKSKQEVTALNNKLLAITNEKHQLANTENQNVVYLQGRDLVCFMRTIIYFYLYIFYINYIIYRYAS